MFKLRRKKPGGYIPISHMLKISEPSAILIETILKNLSGYVNILAEKEDGGVIFVWRRDDSEAVYNAIIPILIESGYSQCVPTWEK